MLPQDAKPLSEWKGKQDKYWRAVAEGIQAVIKKLRQQPRASQEGRRRMIADKN
jgi:hypothetical protein